MTQAVPGAAKRLVTMLETWQRTHNLVGRSTLETLWTRHIADSLQLVPLAPPFRNWVDLGSGAGFPGLVVALAFKGDPDKTFTLVEANGKKAAFLRAAIRETGAPARVAAERIERHGPSMAGQADVLSARALAPLPDLLRLGAPYLHADSVMLLPKGQDFVHELDAASKSWSFDVVIHASATDPAGRILAVRNLRAKVQP